MHARKVAVALPGLVVLHAGCNRAEDARPAADYSWIPAAFDPANDVENCFTGTWMQLSLDLLRPAGDARYAVEAERTTISR